MLERRLQTDNLSLAFDDDGSGEPLVFLHGGTASAEYWESLVPQLLGDFRCVRLEFAGHGRSDRSPTAAYSIDDQVRAAVGLLENETGPAIIVGQSGGAATAFGAAAQRPDLVKGIFSEDAYPGIYTSHWISTNPFVQNFRATGDLVRSLPLGFSIAEFAAATGRRTIGPTTIMEALGPEVVAFMARIRYRTDPVYYDTVVDPSRYWSVEQCASIVRSVSCPVHIAFGDIATGSLVPEHEIDALVAAGVNVTRQHYPRASHVITPFHAREIHMDVRRLIERVGSA